MAPCDSNVRQNENLCASFIKRGALFFIRKSLSCVYGLSGGIQRKAAAHVVSWCFFAVGQKYELRRYFSTFISGLGKQNEGKQKHELLSKLPETAALTFPRGVVLVCQTKRKKRRWSRKWSVVAVRDSCCLHSDETNQHFLFNLVRPFHTETLLEASSHIYLWESNRETWTEEDGSHERRKQRLLCTNRLAWEDELAGESRQCLWQYLRLWGVLQSCSELWVCANLLI